MIAKTKKQFTQRISEIKNPILEIIQRDRSGRDFYIKSDNSEERWFHLPGCRRIFLNDSAVTYASREAKITSKYIGWMDKLCGKDYRIEWR